MQQLYTNPTFHALSLTSLSSAHQRETHVANFFCFATATIAIVAAASLTRLWSLKLHFWLSLSL